MGYRQTTLEIYDEKVLKGFADFFTASTETEARAALKSLTDLGLSETQILAGIEAGEKELLRPSGARNNIRQGIS